MRLIRSNWPLLGAPLFLALVIIVLVLNDYHANDGHLIFALDDPYIHLSMARNFVNTGVWGINPGEFSSSSSAPLYTLALSGLMAIFGPAEYWAWAFAIGGALLTAAMLGRRALVAGFGKWGVTAAGLYFVIIIGLPEFALGGMEHTMHMCVVMALMGSTESVLRQPPGSVRRAWPLVLLVLIAAGLRYETLFLMPPLLLILWFAGWRSLAVLAGLAALLPSLVLGAIQVSQGAGFVPNTIVVKAFDTVAPGPFGYAFRFFGQVSAARWAVLIVGGAAALWIGLQDKRRWTDPRMAGPAILVFVVLAHCAIAIDYPRYIGYLVALGGWTLLPWVREWTRIIWDRAAAWPQHLLAAGLICVSLILPFGHQIRNWTQLPLLGRDIFLQQFQMARFVSKYYPGRAVAFNDIGLVAWTGTNRVLDLWGLANDRVARWRQDRVYTSERIGEVAKEYQIPIAIIYPSWFLRYGGVPFDWYRVGHWELPLKVRTQVGSPVVFFYATSESEAKLLLSNLKQFERLLPTDVQASY